MSQTRVRLTRAAIINAFRRFWMVGCLAIVGGSSTMAQQARWMARPAKSPAWPSLTTEFTGRDRSPDLGFRTGDCVEMIGNEIDRTVRWTSGSDVSSLAGRIVCLRFVMKDADLYALRFAEEDDP